MGDANSDIINKLRQELPGLFAHGANKWSAYNAECLIGRKAPVLGTVSGKKIEEMAEEKMKDRREAFLYVFASAGTWSTEKRNLIAFDEWRIVPRMLRDATSRNIETTILGKTYPSPLFIAPIGVQGIVHPDAELASARAAASLGIPFIMSTASTRSIEDVAQASDSAKPQDSSSTASPRWYQLYWPRTREVTASVLSRAKKSGFTTLVVTLDTMSLGWRPHDLDTTYLPFAHSTGCAVALSDPVFMQRLGLEPWPQGKYVEFPYDPEKLEQRLKEGDKEIALRKMVGAYWIGETNAGKYRTWEDLKELKELWDGPIVLKGVQSVEDAEIALDWVDGIVVSNHGGRQVDGAIASLDALSHITSSLKVRAAQESGKFTVLFDSGIRTGSDILKALALGAQGVLLGRPFMYGLALAGEAGVAEQIKIILSDFEITLGLSGYKDVPSVVRNRRLVEHFPARLTA